MTQDQFDNLRKEMEKKFSQEDIIHMQTTAYKLGVLTAVRNTNGSKDFVVLAKELYNAKDGIVPESEMLEIVTRFYPKLIEEKMIEPSGKLTPEAIVVVLQYDALLNPPTVQPKTAWTKGFKIKALDGATAQDLRINRGDTATIVHDKSLIIEEENNAEVILVIWDKDEKKKPRTWHMEFATLEGMSDEYDDKDLSKEWKEIEDLHNKVLEFAKNGKKMFSSNEEILMEKIMMARAGVYKLTKAEKTAAKRLEEKARKLMG